ncbi:MAG: hypothetical protein UIM26_05965 [Longicatena sp.]|nr:hypothetical protein [Longicatena sp.]
MKDSEFKKLNRAQLIDIIYQLQLQQEELIKENEKLSKALEERRIRVNKTGSVAQAALEIHDVMKAAQKAADHYLEEVRVRVNFERKRIIQMAMLEAEDIIAYAKQRANGYVKTESSNHLDSAFTDMIEKIRNI